MPNRYSDSRKNMHPDIASSVPNTPEAEAILRGNYYIPYTFGGLVTKLVENGHVDDGTFDAARYTTCELLDISPDDFDRFMQLPDTIPSFKVDEWSNTISSRQQKLAHENNRASWQEHIVTKASGVSQDPQINQLEKLVEEQTARANDALTNYDRASTFHKPFKWLAVQAYTKHLDATEASRFAITLDDFLAVLRYDQRTQSSFATYGEKSGMYTALSAELERKRGIHVPDLIRLELEDEDSADPEILKQKLALHSIWLAEADVAVLAAIVAKEYECTQEWRDRPRPVNPIEEVFIVRPEQIREFNNAFPVASAKAPLGWLISGVMK